MVKRKKCSRKKKGDSIFHEERCAQVNDSKDKKSNIRMRMQVTRLQRSVEREEERLREFDITPESPVKKKKKGHRDNDPDSWVLKGAARPAALLARIEAGELDERGNKIRIPKIVDLFTKYKGEFSEHEETKEYVKLRFELAEACRSMDMNSSAIKHYQGCLEVDLRDTLNVRKALVCVLLDEGRAGEARAIMDTKNSDACTVFAYSRALTEYVSWNVLNETDSSEDLARQAFINAFNINPYIAVFITGYDWFSQVVELVDEIKNPRQGTIEEAFVYCSKNVGVWMDTDGLRDWMCDVMSDLDEPQYDETVCDNPMYLGMFETAMEMMGEAAQEQTLEQQENEEPDTDNKNTDKNDSDLENDDIE